MSKVPEAGKPLEVDDVEMILDAVAKRRENFPDEPAGLTFMLVLLNIGDRFAPVTCQEQEWEGYIQDVPKGEGVPKCPNGHTLVRGNPLKLGWVMPEEE
mgnify:CR=1 FL=1